MAPADAVSADARARALLDENALLRREIDALRERSARREIEFRRELRALAAQCASLAAAAAVTSASAAATTEATQTEATTSADARASERLGGGGRGVDGRPRRTAAPPTAWEVPNARPTDADDADRAAARSGEVSDRVREAVEEEARRRGGGRRGADADAFVGDLSSFFFKTAKHEAPVWESKRGARGKDGDAASILRSARDDASEDDVDASAFAAPSRPARETDPFDWTRGFSAASLEVEVEDEREADLIDSLRDDDDLVDALLRGGRDGERAAETLASRLRSVGFADA